MSDNSKEIYQAIAQTREPSNFIRFLTLLEFEDERAAREGAHHASGRLGALRNARTRMQQQSEDPNVPAAQRARMRRELLTGRVSATEEARAVHTEKTTRAKYEKEKSKSRRKKKLANVLVSDWDFVGSKKRGPPPPPPPPPTGGAVFV